MKRCPFKDPYIAFTVHSYFKNNIIYQGFALENHVEHCFNFIFADRFTKKLSKFREQDNYLMHEPVEQDLWHRIFSLIRNPEELEYFIVNRKKFFLVCELKSSNWAYKDYVAVEPSMYDLWMNEKRDLAELNNRVE